MFVLNKVDQTTNTFTKNSADYTNIPTKLTEHSVKKLPNVTVDDINDDGTKEGKKYNVYFV